MTRQLERSFKPIYGLPCWGVKPGYGEFLTLEFGEPHLSIREPINPSPGASARVQRRVSRRNVTVHGDWHLWIYCCDWEVCSPEKIVGDCTNRRKAQQAADFIDGQKLMSFAFNQKNRQCVFTFDLGAILVTRPFDRKSEQWMLFEPSGKVLTLRADRKYSHGSSNTTPHSDRWHEIGGNA